MVAGENCKIVAVEGSARGHSFRTLRERMTRMERRECSRGEQGGMTSDCSTYQCLFPSTPTSTFMLRCASLVVKKCSSSSMRSDSLLFFLNHLSSFASFANLKKCIEAFFFPVMLPGFETGKHSKSWSLALTSALSKECAPSPAQLRPAPCSSDWGPSIETTYLSFSGMYGGPSNPPGSWVRPNEYRDRTGNRHCLQSRRIGSLRGIFLVVATCRCSCH
ncbi:hypothetical protein BU26DRAFT_152172 [Trematosphaeria pertusa]|uniref:Uncharacterized protein n=1 Tax=Trematosphaeria pertusa TaxID=390896 RepID=A0A6A6IXD4_9PLEO|nr:uncharacterized protein BU26DRAFT_152172 [Trematosphaeria pertusa]KAF2255201.1 hypothetical protein BU26DRAFT_152172 [Trematosphaeria pertusa]